MGDKYDKIPQVSISNEDLEHERKQELEDEFENTMVNFRINKGNELPATGKRKTERRQKRYDERLVEVRSIYTDNSKQLKNQKKSQTKRKQFKTIDKEYNSEQIIKVRGLHNNGKIQAQKIQTIQTTSKPKKPDHTSYRLQKNKMTRQEEFDLTYVKKQKTEVSEDEVSLNKKLPQQKSKQKTLFKIQQVQTLTPFLIPKDFIPQAQREKQEKQKRQRQEKQLRIKYENENKKSKENISVERSREIEKAKQILSGRVSIIWIFAISGDMDSQYRDRILKMYNGVSSKKYIAPICKTGPEIKPFLSIKNSLFKIVSDLQNIEEALRFKINKSVVQYYIFNQKGEEGISQAIQFKRQSRKVKAIYTKLDKIITKAEDQLQNQIYLYETKNGLEKKKHVKFFPSFLKLSGEDKSEATSYRSNLFGAKNLPTEEKKEMLKEFLDLVVAKYEDVEKEKNNIIEYKLINHEKEVENEKQARKIISFYVRESFYYQILNSMLRTMKTTDEFRPCILPFNETYQAIKCFYSRKKSKIAKQTLYRGAKLRKKDFQSLKPNVFIEMFGFMSTSHNFERAKQFTGKDGYIFIIQVPERTIPEKFKNYDHGFVDINEHNLAPDKFAIEEEVLFNALNIFKVKEVVEDDSGFTLIRIQYGVIFDLLAKKKGQMTDDEKDVLLNYQYCIEMLSDIEDQGDVHLLANEFEQSKNYYKNKLEGKDQEGKNLYKLANVQQKCGELQEADINAKKSLEIQLKELDKNDREKCLKVFSIHSKNAEISLEKEDYLLADDALTDAINMISDQDEFEKAKKIRQRGQIKFKKGQIINAEKDFGLSEKLFKNISQKGQKKREEIQKKYFWSFLTFCCGSQTVEELQEQKQQELKQIQQLQTQIADLKDSINYELIKVNSSMKDVAEYAEDKEKYQLCVKKARSYLLEIQASKTNDPREKAKLKALEATVQDYLDLVESEKLLNQAIALVESTDPHNEEVGKYSEVLANLQKQNLQKFSNPKVLMKSKLKKGLPPIPYNGKQHQQVYDKCKKNYQKAINVLLYNSKSHGSPEVMTLKNQLGQLDYNENNYQSSYKIIKEVKEAGQNKQHTQVSKSCLLLSKIAYSRGQLKNSFENVEEAKKILKQSIVKKEDDKYYNIYHHHDTYLQIKLHRSKVYLKQLKHDLSLKDIQKVKTILNHKLQQQDFHSLLPQALQLQAQNVGTGRGNNDFDSYFEKAIKLRQKQIGECNLANAVAYCNYAKFLIVYHDYEGASEALAKAAQIFSCFSSDHPITWLVLYCYSIYKAATSHEQESLKDLEKCLEMALKKFDKTHITMSKIRLQYAKQLYKSGNIDSAIKQYEQLQQDLQNNLRDSIKRSPVQVETDDEKITVKKLLYTSLQNTYRSVQQSTSELKISKAQSYEEKIKNLRQTYHIS